MSTIEELIVFFGRIHLYFPSSRHKGLFCKNTKMYIFPTCFAKRNFRGHFLRKFLKTLPNKICDVMWGWEISTWRMKPINHLPYISQLVKHFAVLTLAKISQGWVFHSIPSASDQSKWFQQRWLHKEHSSSSFLTERWKLFSLLQSFWKKILLARP